ncbi:hypothetical protein H0H81_011232 [Sphagnurus paluster]|uniref:Uncharacterized protein n=1 Tax=Sphagnurus paluster TaxID=117069 RepID=A0A9P7GHJ0_9AGAR|nr:hypothetical protein H0H81_011232 [Sphagnurus paluster]
MNTILYGMLHSLGAPHNLLNLSTLMTHIPQTMIKVFNVAMISPKLLHRQSHTSASDISRLLDPLYASPNTYSSTSAYVDGDGELHDPDFHCFPVMNPKPDRASQSRYAAYKKATRPCWESVLDSELESDFDDDDDDLESTHNSTIKSRVTYKRRYPSYYPTYSAQPNLEENRPSAPQEEPSLRGMARIIDRTKREFRARCPSASSSSNSNSSLPSSSVSELSEEEKLGLAAEEKWTRTYDYKMRRQWAIIDERIRFGVFRAQKRFRRKRILTI